MIKANVDVLRLLSDYIQNWQILKQAKTTLGEDGAVCSVIYRDKSGGILGVCPDNAIDKQNKTEERYWGYKVLVNPDTLARVSFSF